MEQLEPPGPDCSVVVATHRRPDQLGRCLGALASQDYPGDRLEVIVVDDGGGVSLEPWVAPFRDRLDLTLVVERHAGPAAARNCGAARARGALLAFTDDDCRPDPRWLSELVKRHRVHPDRALGGRTVNELADSPYSTISDLVVAVGYEQNNRSPDTARFFASNNLAVPREGFRAIGGFDPEFTTSEDRDLCDRWLAQGRTMSYVPEALVRHAHPLTFWSFCRQHFGNGRGLALFHQAYARRAGRRVRLEVTYYLKLLRTAQRAGRGLGKLGLPVLVVVCQLSNAAGFLWEGSRSRRPAGATPAYRV